MARSVVVAAVADALVVVAAVAAAATRCRRCRYPLSLLLPRSAVAVAVAVAIGCRCLCRRCRDRLSLSQSLPRAAAVARSRSVSERPNTGELNLGRLRSAVRSTTIPSSAALTTPLLTSRTGPMSSPVPFDQFMDDALYGPTGFYTQSGSAGRRGDFITSPEVGPLFGAVLARHLDAEWRRIGEPDVFTVVDAGAGPGTLARSILAASPDCAQAMRYVAVEVSAAQRERHPDGIESTEALPDGPIDGVIIANELLDNLPFRLAVYDQGWREAFVDLEVDGARTEQLGPPLDPPRPMLPPTAKLGSRAPLVDRAAVWVDDARSRLRSGSLLVIDYGVGRTGELAMRPWRDWLRTYRSNQRGEHYLAAPGTQDITTDVPFDQLPEPDSLRSQAQFLQLRGIDELVEEGRRIWTEQAARPGLEAIKMRSRISESEALLDPAGLGGFLVAEWRAIRDAPAPDALIEHLRTMPDVGDDRDVARSADTGRVQEL